jgi:hypothetical protein
MTHKHEVTYKREKAYRKTFYSLNGGNEGSGVAIVAGLDEYRKVFSIIVHPVKVEQRQGMIMEHFEAFTGGRYAICSYGQRKSQKKFGEFVEVVKRYSSEILDKAFAGDYEGIAQTAVDIKTAYLLK